MNKLLPPITLYGSNTYLGAHLAINWQKQKSSLVEINEETAALDKLPRTPSRVVFLARSSLNQLEEVAIFKELLALPSLKLVSFTLITHVDVDATDAFLEKMLAEKLPSSKWQIIRVPTIFGPGAPLKEQGVLGDYLRNLHNGEPLGVPGEGLNKFPLLFINDAVTITNSLISQALGQIYPIIPEEILTELELAYLIKSLASQKPTVIFKPGGKMEGSHFVPIATTNYPTTPLREALRQVVGNLGNLPPQLTNSAKTEKELVKNKSGAGKRPTNKVISGSVAISILTLIIISGWFLWCPLAATAYFGYLGKNQLTNSLTKFKALDLNGANVSAKNAASSLETGLQNWQKLPEIPIFRQTEQVLRSGQYVAEGLAAIAEVGTVYLSPAPAEADLLAMGPKIKEASNKLTLATLEMPSNLNYDRELLLTLQSSLKMASELSTSLPSLLGFDRPKTYLLLFQNPMELRATGGFIGSYAQITVSKAIVTNLLLDDIYNPDGQLEQKGLAGPLPPEMATAMPALKKLYLRDANWWVSFPTSASSISNLYKLATDTTVDGVVALDLYLVKDLLALTGPVYLGSYNKDITASNLYEEMQANAESNYFIGSPQKKNFLQLLGNKLWEKIGQLSSNQKIALLGIINKNLAEKHILLSVFNDNAALVLTENRWDGAVTALQNSDFLMAVDTNIGGNKANYTVQRSLDYEVQNTTREGTLDGLLTINYVNTATSSSWPGGTYQNYLRVLVPKGSLLTEASMEQLPVSNPTGKGLVKTGEENGLTVFSFGFSLDPKQSLTLKLRYTLPPSLALTPTTKIYNLRVLKQPGTAGDAFSFRFAPAFGRTLGVPAGFKVEAQGISYGTTLVTDLDLQIPIN